MLDTSFRVPEINYRATPDMPQKKELHAIAEPFNECKKCAATHFKMLSEAYKLYYFKPPEPRGYGDAIVGAFFAFAAPGWGVQMVMHALPRFVGGALGTAALYPAYAVEWSCNQVKRWVWPVDVALQQREHLTQQFINRLNEMMESVPMDKMMIFVKNPEQLINIGVIAVAFLSRHQPRGLKVGEKVLFPEDIQSQDEVRRQYFHDICDIKRAIALLTIDIMPDDEAWSHLMQLVQTCQIDTSQMPQEEEWGVLRSQDEYIALLVRQNPGVDKNFLRLFAISYMLSRDISSDEVFKKLWKVSHP